MNPRTPGAHEANSSPQVEHFIDALTGLWNRTFLFAEGQRLLVESHKAGGVAALFMLDLDDFKTVNDTLGHAAGDETLRQIGSRLALSLPPTVLIARLAGDEFVVLAPLLPSPEEVEALACSIATAMERPIHWNEVSLQVDASVGTAVYPRDGNSVESLMRAADDAMYLAKAAGSVPRRGTSGVGSRGRWTQGSSTELANGIRRHELLNFYQPQVDARTGQVASFETLVRWQHPGLGLLEPAEFLPLADSSNLMGELTHCVLNEGLRDLSSLLALVPEATLSVNMTARSLLGRGLGDTIAGLLREYGIPPARLVIEVNEPPARHSRSLVAIFEALHGLGCQASIHEFGRGQASLSVLGRYPAISEIKIDPTLVATISDPASATMVRAIVSVAQALGLRTVAEGIESAFLAEEAVAMSCDRLQGFFIAPPMAFPELKGWLSTSP